MRKNVISKSLTFVSRGWDALNTVDALRTDEVILDPSMSASAPKWAYDQCADCRRNMSEGCMTATVCELHCQCYESPRYFIQLKGRRIYLKNNCKMKLTIVGVREYSFPDRQDPTKMIEGKMYIAYAPSGKALEFSSREDHEVYEGEIEFNAAKSEDITLQTKLRQDGKIGYKEAVVET